MVSFGFAPLGPKGYGIAISTVHSALEKATVKSSTCYQEHFEELKFGYYNIPLHVSLWHQNW